MAAPPKQRAWNVEPPADATWFSDAIAELNSFIDATTYALTAQLSRADNLRSMKKVLSVDTSAASIFPLTFDCTLNATPEEIRVAQVQNLTSPGVIPDAITCVNWELLAGAKIRLYGITGLAANTKYTITLIVE